MKRILVDRSIFHGDKFKQIQASNLLHAVHSGEVQVYYTAVFLEETLRNIRRDMSMFTQHWKYICDLNHQHWFKNTTEIIKTECASRASGAYYLRTEDDISALLYNVDNLITGHSPLTILEPAVNDTMAEQQRNITLRRTILKFRSTKKFALNEFDQFIETNTEAYFQNVLLPAVGVNKNIIRRWKNNQEEFPFTNYFIRCLFSTFFIPISDHQSTVHKNDKSDAVQLAFLLWTDVLVTDDMKFMTKTFEFLNREGHKECWTLNDLLNRLSNLRMN